MKKSDIKKVVSMGMLLTLLLTGCGKGPQETGAANESLENQGDNGYLATLLQKDVQAAPEINNKIKNNYEMNVSLNPDTKVMESVVSITVNNTSEDSWDSICLRDYIPAIAKVQEEATAIKSDMTSQWASVIDVETGDSLDYSRNDDDQSVVFVQLSESLAPGEATTIEITYTVNLSQDSVRLRWTDYGQDKYVFELANFYPVVAIYENGQWQQDPFIFDGECFYSTVSDYAVKLTVPEDYIVAASGVESVGTQEEGTTTWLLHGDNVRDMAMTVSNHISKVSETVDGVEVNSYYFNTETGKTQGDLMLEHGVESLKLFNRAFGKYPYESLDIVMTTDMLNALEYPAVVRVMDLSENLDPNSEFSSVDSLIETVAHEVAHQWFYAVVGNNSYQEPWLDESFASFGALIYLGKSDSKEAMDTLASDNRAASEKEQDVYLNENYGELGQSYIITTYFKGQVFLYDLMKLMGEEEFFAMMQDYYTTWGYKEAHTKDFVDVLYKHTDSQDVKALVEKNIKL